MDKYKKKVNYKINVITAFSNLSHIEALILKIGVFHDHRVPRRIFGDHIISDFPGGFGIFRGLRKNYL